MKYLTFASQEDIHNPCLGVLIEDTVVDLSELRTWAQGARFIPSETLPESLIVVTSGPQTERTVVLEYVPVHRLSRSL